MVPGIPGSIVPENIQRFRKVFKKFREAYKKKSPRKIPGIKKFQEIQKVPGTKSRKVIKKSQEVFKNFRKIPSSGKVPGSTFKDPGIFQKRS